MFDDSIFPKLFNTISFPKKLAIIGSGNTKPPLSWEGLPSIRINQETLHPIDKYPFLPLHTIITTRQFRGRCAKIIKNRNDESRPYLWCFDTAFDSVENRIEEKRYIRVGIEWKEKSYPKHLGDYFTKTRLNGPTPHCKYSAGFYSILFMFLSNIKELYIAGFDAYKQQNKYFHIDQDRVWKTKRHNLNYEWLCLEKLFQKLKSQRIQIIVQKDPI